MSVFDTFLGLAAAVAIIIGGILLGVALLCVKIWFLGSLATSTVKLFMGQCGTTYGIEDMPLIQGGWFCG